MQGHQQRGIRRFKSGFYGLKHRARARLLCRTRDPSLRDYPAGLSRVRNRCARGIRSGAIDAQASHVDGELARGRTVTPTASGTVEALLLAGAIVLGGLLSEDGATITAATLTASSSINPKLAFFSAFVGLWAGDFGVYVLARKVGPSILQSSRFQRWFGKAEPVVSGRAAGNGRWTLALSRFFPGTRVPAYISAGLGRMPAAVFAAITAVSALAWVLLVFAAIQLAPAQVGSARQKLSILGLFGLGLLVLLYLWRRWGLKVRKRVATQFARMSKWEFWPA